MAAENEVGETMADVEVGLDGFTRSEDQHALVSGWYASQQPECQSCVVECGSHVEAWIQEEFGDDMEASNPMQHQEDSFTTLMRHQAHKYIETVGFMHDTTTVTTTDSMFDDPFDANIEDSDLSEEFDMCYEPQLWTFTR